ncbi:MAG: sulfotransferase [Chloroflexi bacterium]|nr:sulfotransferase [Chloroflexota bacterium]
MMITIIGRGHGGTRAMSQTLVDSGVFMGAPLNKSYDLLPPQDMYDACRVLAKHVRWLGGLEWDWSALHTMPIPDEFIQLIRRYLVTVLESPSEHTGWKIPETTLVFPWILRMFPDIKYIHWVRNPRDAMLNRHMTDNLNDFGIEYPPTDDLRRMRAISWYYQYRLVQATPKPANWITVRFEDFVLHQEETLARLEGYLGIKLARIAVQPETVGRWRTDEGVSYYDFLEPAMREFDYEFPAAASS